MTELNELRTVIYIYMYTYVCYEIAGHKDVVLTVHCVEIAGHRDVCVSYVLYGDSGAYGRLC